MRSFWVYFLASRSKVLYIGVTSDLERRLAEHRSGLVSSFTKRYAVSRLVRAERFATVWEALRREKQLKGWRRARKVALVEAENPNWEDLARDGRV